MLMPSSDAGVAPNHVVSPRPIQNAPAQILVTAQTTKREQMVEQVSISYLFSRASTMPCVFTEHLAASMRCSNRFAVSVQLARMEELQRAELERVQHLQERILQKVQSGVTAPWHTPARPVATAQPADVQPARKPQSFSKKAPASFNQENVDPSTC